MYICRLWCQCSFKHLFFTSWADDQIWPAHLSEANQNFLVSMILRGNVAREQMQAQIFVLLNPFSSLLVANGFKERAWHPGIQSKLGLLQKGLGWRLWLFDFLWQFVWICRFAPFWWQTYKQVHQFFVFSLFSFFVGGGVSEGDQIQKSKHHLPSAQFGRNSFMSDFSIRMYLFISKNRKWRS